MSLNKAILVINPGSTSTKIAVFNGIICGNLIKLSHSVEMLKKFETVYDQKDMRTEIVLQWLKKEGIELESLSAVVGRGGLLRPIPGGTYIVTEKMLKDLKIGYGGQHAANLGGIIAFEIAKRAGINAYIVDSVAVDEFEEVARISGFPYIHRKSFSHALNLKAVSRRISEKLGKDINECSFVVAHMGGGISVASIKGGRIIDVNNANESGPFSPERSGGLPALDIVSIAFSGKYTQKELNKKLVGGSGLAGYLRTNDAKEVERRIQDGDEKAQLIFNSMAYQIGKEIGASACVLKGKVDRVILTGGLAYNERLTDYIKEMVKFIAPIEIVPGEDEMLALAQGALRVLNSEEKTKIYDDEVCIYE